MQYITNGYACASQGGARTKTWHGHRRHEMIIIMGGSTINSLVWNGNEWVESEPEQDRIFISDTSSSVSLSLCAFNREPKIIHANCRKQPLLFLAFFRHEKKMQEKHQKKSIPHRFHQRQKQSSHVSVASIRLAERKPDYTDAILNRFRFARWHFSVNQRLQI